MPYYDDPYRERVPDTNALVEVGWQTRIRQELNRDGKARERVQFFSDALSEAWRERRGITIVQGDIRDMVFAARAADEWVAESNLRASHRQLVIGEQSVDNAIAGAHAVSAAINPDNVIGGYVGYATGQGQLMGPDTRVGVSAKSNLLQHVLQGRLNRDSVGTFIVDDAESQAVDNQLLLGALQQLHEAGIAPPIVLISRRADRASVLGKFFGVDPFDQTFDENRASEDRQLPLDIRYESVKEPHHVKPSIRTAEIITEIMTRKKSLYDLPDSIMVFLRDDQTVKQALRELDKKLRDAKQYGQDGKAGRINYENHRVLALTHDQPLNDRLQIQLNTPTWPMYEVKGLIVVSSLPADVLGFTKQFDVVIDEHRADTRGGYFSIDRAEAERRARYAKPDGVCYRLTTEQEFVEPRYRQLSYGYTRRSEAGYIMDEQAKTEAQRQLDRSGVDAASFPWLNEVKPDEPESDGWYDSDESDINDGWSDGNEPADTAASEPAPYVSSSRWIEPVVAPRPVVEIVPPTPLQELARDLDVNEHVAKVVETLRERGKLQLGLGIAACVREARIVESDYLAKRKAVLHFDTKSDVLLRLRALADVRSGRLQMRQSRDIGLNEGSLGHLSAIADRYARKFGVDMSNDKAYRAMRDMTEDELSDLLLEVIPDRVVSYTNNTSRSDFYLAWCNLRKEMNQDMKPGQQSVVEISIHERDVEQYGIRDDDARYGYATNEEADAAWDRRKAAYKKITDRLNANRLFYVALATAGAEDQFITTAHPLSTEAVIAALPELVRRETDGALLNKQTGFVEQTSRVLVNRGERYSRSISRKGEPEPKKEIYWEEIEATTEVVNGEQADAIRVAAVAEQEAFTQARGSIITELNELEFITQQVLERTSGNRTAAEDRLLAIRKLRDRLQRDEAANDISMIQEEATRHAERVALLVRKSSKEAGWNSDWPAHFHNISQGVVEAVTQHAFAQECIGNGDTSTEAVTVWINNQLRTEQLTRIQHGDDIDLVSLIDDALNQLVK